MTTTKMLSCTLFVVLVLGVVTVGGKMYVDNRMSRLSDSDAFASKVAEKISSAPKAVPSGQRTVEITEPRSPDAQSVTRVQDDWEKTWEVERSQ